MSEDDVTTAIKPKSDQLNSDDLLVGPITVSITGVKVTKADQQAISVSISHGFQPYKPCKGMARIMAQAWGPLANKWVGKSLTLFRNPEVKYAGEKTGGIEISHMSDIDGDRVFKKTVARGKKVDHPVKRLTTQNAAPQVEQYPDDKFAVNLPIWRELIRKGEKTVEQVFKNAERGGRLTAVQKLAITAQDAAASDDGVF